jgi:hypothetical protein
MESKDVDESFAAAKEKAKAQVDEWGDLGRPSSKLPAPGESLLVEDDDYFLPRLRELGIDNFPDVTILPRNFKSAPSLDRLAFERETSDLRVLGRQAGVEVAPLVEKRAEIHENDIATIGAVIVIAKAVLETVNSVATLVEFFGRLGKFLGEKQEEASRGERIEIVQEVIVTNGIKATRVTYRGSAADLGTVVETLKREADALDG